METNKQLIAELYTANQRAKYCQEAKERATKELAYAEKVLIEVIDKSNKSTLTLGEIFQALEFGGITK